MIYKMIYKKRGGTQALDTTSNSYVEISPLVRDALSSRLELFLYVLAEGSFVHFFRTGMGHGLDKFDPLRKLKHRGLLPFQERNDFLKG
jgi:hypothetical protein